MRHLNLIQPYPGKRVPGMTVLHSEAGVTLIESVICALIIAITVAGVAAMTSHSLALVEASKENLAATRLLESRAEQLRGVTWANLTNGAYLQNTVLSGSSLAASQSALTNSAIETLTVYPLSTNYSATQAGAITVVRSSGSSTISRTGDGTVATATAVVVDVTIQWTRGASKTTRTVSKSMVISNGGINGTL